MKSFLRRAGRELAAGLMRLTGLPWLVRATYARGKVAIIVYHDPPTDTFRRHLQFLARRYRFIPLDTLVDALHSGDWSQVPPRALVITFDDGHRRNHALLPALREFGVEPTMFLASGVIGTLRHFWFMAAKSGCQKFMPLENDTRLGALRHQYGYEPTREYARESRQALSREELDELHAVCRFGGHTRFHPVLTTCSPEDCRREIVDGKHDLETAFDADVQHFAYPHGDYTQREIEEVRRAGFRSGRTIDVGFVHRKTDPYRLPVVGVADTASLNLLAVQLSGVSMFLRYLLQGSLTGRRRVTRPQALPAPGESIEPRLPQAAATPRRPRLSIEEDALLSVTREGF